MKNPLEKLIIVSIVGIIGTTALTAVKKGSAFSSPGDRTYEGQVVSFGKQGLLFDTYEGTIALGGAQRSINEPFSLDASARHGEDTYDLAKKLDEAVRTQRPVVIRERVEFFAGPWRGATNSFVYEVEFRE